MTHIHKLLQSTLLVVCASIPLFSQANVMRDPCFSLPPTMEEEFSRIFPKTFEIKIPLMKTAPGQTFEMTVKTTRINQTLLERMTTVEWSVTGGEILDGQGTWKIKVKASNASETLKANVQILNYSGEDYYATKIRPVHIYTVAFEPDHSELKAQFKSLVQRLNCNPSAKGYIYIVAADRNVGNHIEKSIQDHAASLKFDSGRLMFAHKIDRWGNNVFLFLLPRGAIPPER